MVVPAVHQYALSATAKVHNSPASDLLCQDCLKYPVPKELKAIRSYNVLLTLHQEWSPVLYPLIIPPYFLHKDCPSSGTLLRYDITEEYTKIHRLCSSNDASAPSGQPVEDFHDYEELPSEILLFLMKNKSLHHLHPLKELTEPDLNNLLQVLDNFLRMSDSHLLHKSKDALC